MKTRFVNALIVLFAVALLVTVPVHAKNDHQSNNRPNTQGYPNGAGWQAVKRDLRRLALGIAVLRNTLDVQVSVDLDPGAATPPPGVDRVIARILVQVNRLGAGFDTLDDTSFTYSNTYAPVGGATGYCGLNCFAALGNGLYVLEITGQDYVPGTYAATLAVEDLSAPHLHPIGTALVTFALP